MNNARSLAAWAGAIDSIPATAKPASAARHASRILEFIIVTLPGLKGHVSHKRFEPPLILQSQFEEKPTKQLDECCYHLTQIRTKFESIQFESNAGINPSQPFTRSPAAGGSSGIKNLPASRPIDGRRKRPVEFSPESEPRRIGTALIYRPVTLCCRNAAATDPGAGPARLPQCARPPM
jgi:hypothetical protein